MSNILLSISKHHIRRAATLERGCSDVALNINNSPSRAVTRPFTTEIAHTALKSGGAVAHVHFTAPETSKNKTVHILSPHSIAHLTGTLKLLASDETIRALFIHDSIAGADLKHMQNITSPADAREFIRTIDALCTAIQKFPTPVVAICRGFCFGAGMELAAAADLRITTEGTLFGMPETKLGIPSVVQASLIPGLIGWGRARELLYFGGILNAKDAESWGFVNVLTTEDKLDGLVAMWVGRFDKTGSRALRLQKRLMREWQENGCGRNGIDASVDYFAAAYETDEPRRMMSEFLAARIKEKTAAR